MTGPIKLTEEMFDQFATNVVKSDGCWGWKGKLGTTGLALCSNGKARIAAKKISWCIIHPLDEQYIVPNKIYNCCKNPACTNPRHLYTVIREFCT